MKLECAERISHKNVTEEQLREAFRNDKARGEFIILSQDDQHYIQASGECEGPYDLEYRDGGNDQHFRAAGEFTKEQVEQVFVRYFKNDQWRTACRWEQLNLKTKPWWKFW